MADSLPPADLSALETAVREAMSRVIDPEIRRPIADLGMIRSIEVRPLAGGGAQAVVGIDLTTAGCPMKSTLSKDSTAAALSVDGIDEVAVELGVMSTEQRAGLRSMLRGGEDAPRIPFAEPGSLTRVYAIASGKGGVGKSSVTANLAAAMARDGLAVGVIDADIYGFSIPGMLGLSGQPTRVDDMIIPQVAFDVKVMSIGMFVPPNQAVVWRGPMLHRALQQFLTDVFWGDLDVLLLDLPPGTGDIAISVAQLLPQSELLVVTTPQQAAAQVAERAGSITTQTNQRLAGVIENMSWMQMPDGTRMDVFGTGGGASVAANLSETTGAEVELIAQIPLDTRVREGSDAGTPFVLAHPDSPAAEAFTSMAAALGQRARGLSGKSLGLSPV